MFEMVDLRRQELVDILCQVSVWVGGSWWRGGEGWEGGGTGTEVCIWLESSSQPFRDAFFPIEPEVIQC